MGTCKLFVSYTRKKWQASFGSFHKPAERGALTGAGLLARLVTPWWVLPSLWRTAAWEKDSSCRNSWRPVCHGKDPVMEQGKSVRSTSPKRKGGAETTMSWLQPHFSSPCANGVKRLRKLEVKLNWERGRSGRKAFLRFGRFLPLPYCDW